MERVQTGKPSSSAGNTREQVKEMQVSELHEIASSQTWVRIYQNDKVE